MKWGRHSVARAFMIIFPTDMIEFRVVILLLAIRIYFLENGVKRTIKRTNVEKNKPKLKLTN